MKNPSLVAERRYPAAPTRLFGMLSFIVLMLVLLSPGVVLAQTYPNQEVLAGETVSWSTTFEGGHATGHSPPSKGTASWSPNVVNYTANANAEGADSFSYSARLCSDELCEYPYWVTHQFSVTIIPGPPTAQAVASSTPYGQAVSLSPTIERATLLEVVSGPANGVASVSGMTLSYTPASGFYGVDSFTFQAQGPGGTSAPATATVTVEPPPVPTLSGGSLALDFNSGGSVALAPTNGGVLEIVTPPVHGVANVQGDAVAYTPSPDYIGTDSFEVIARNVSGASAPVQVSVTVAPPPLPVIQSGSLSLDFNESGEHDFAPTNGGSLEVVSAPANGVVSLSGGRGRYSPAHDFIGTDSFTVLARNLGGASSPATVTVTVRPPPAPQITGGALSLAFNESGEHNFAPTHGGALSVSAAPSHGTVSIIGGRAEYQPALDYIGPDLFAVVATNLGGVSAPATVNVTVAPPPPPAVANSSMIVAYEQAMESDLAVSGRFDSVVIVSAPQHGIVTVVGRRATYVPAQGYYGSDSFSFEAAGLGGVSAAATVAVTVERPDVPVVVSDSLSAPYEASVGFVVQVSGYYDELVVVTEPARGALQLAGRNGTYTPHGGAYGADRFELKAIGPGGESQPVEFTVSIATPAAPTISGDDATVGYGEAAAIELQVNGVFSEIEVVSPPLKGAATLNGRHLTYTPSEGFSGVASIGVRAVGPGGRSATLQLRVSVGAPPPPEPMPPTAPKPPVQPVEPPQGPPPSLVDRVTPALRDSVVVIDVVQALQGVEAIEILEGPSVGEVAIAPPALRYTPPQGFTGQVTISYRLLGAFGATEAATVTIQIDAPPAPPPVKAVAASVAAPATVTLTEGVEGGPFTGARVISVSPSTSGVAEILGEAPRASMRSAMRAEAPASSNSLPPAGGASEEAAGEYKLRFTPEEGFYGEVEVRYGLVNKYGVMAEGSVRVAVDNRDDPSRDAQVRATINAQTQASIRFGSAQLSNVSRRLEARRAGQDYAVMASLSNPRSPRGEADADPSVSWAKADMARAAGEGVHPAGQPTVQRGPSLAGVWVGGALEMAATKGAADVARIDVESAGMSMGADAALWPNALIGAGIGYGRDLAEIEGGSEVDSRASSAFVYGSWQFVEGAFIDTVLGASRLSMETQRQTLSGDLLAGDREGRMLFASVGTGLDRAVGRLEWGTTIRLDYIHASLGEYEETGPASARLVIGKQGIEQLAGRLGLRVAYSVRTPQALWRPFARLEYAADLRSADDARVGYAVGGEGLDYAVPITSWTDGRLTGGLGLAWTGDSGWRLMLELDGSSGPAGTSSALRIGGAGRF